MTLVAQFWGRRTSRWHFWPARGRRLHNNVWSMRPYTCARVNGGLNWKFLVQTWVPHKARLWQCGECQALTRDDEGHACGKREPRVRLDGPARPRNTDYALPRFGPFGDLYDLYDHAGHRPLPPGCHHTRRAPGSDDAFGQGRLHLCDMMPQGRSHRFREWARSVD